MKRAGRRLAWLAYGLAPRWLAAIMATYSVLREAEEATGKRTEPDQWPR